MASTLQGLRAAITTLDRLVQENQTLILQLDPRFVTGTVLGGIRSGHKRLFLVTVRSTTSVFV